MIIKLHDIKAVYEEEIVKNIKNKEQVFNFERQKLQYLLHIKGTLENNNYNGGKYNIFLIKRPKIRVIMSLKVYDKIINHYVSRYILIPKLEKYLNDRNCATRKGMGIDYAIKKLKNDIESFKKYDNIYFLKIDISKFFYNIDHQVLKSLIQKDLNDDEFSLVCKIIDSTNMEYINKKIALFENKYNIELPRYNYGKGLPIGNMTSQFLAIFYLSKLQYYMINNLHLKFINYMDDYIIIHHDKDYLKKCLNIIKTKLGNEYKLNINEKKTCIVNAKNGISFLGYNFKIVNKKTIIKLNKQSKSNIRKGIKRAKYLYMHDKINYKMFFGSIENYKNGYPFAKEMVFNIFNRYW